MTRLPTPGADEGTWGAILNNFLLQSHAVDGTLKASIVSASQLADNAVTEVKLDSAVQTKLNSTGDPSMGGDLSGTASNAQLVNGVVGTAQLADNTVSTVKLQNNAVTTTVIADGAVTAAKLGTDVTTVARTDGLRSLLIFYAPPNIINAKYDNDYAAGILSRYDDVVLGTGLENPGDANYASTVSIIQKVGALGSGTIIWGYINCGITTGNLSLSTLQTQIDQWLSIGAQGIFCDVMGYDYGVSRDRQNSIIDYIHSKGVGAILNAYTADDLFSSAVNATYNPSGTATHANSSDVYLLESWVCNSDSYSSPYYATFSDIKTRGDAARSYRQSLGIRIFTANILSYNGRTDSEIDGYRGVTEALARIWRLDGMGIAASTYSASGSDVGVVRPRFPLLRPNQLRKNAPYTLNGGWTQVEAADLGISVSYDAGTHSWTQA